VTRTLWGKINRSINYASNRRVSVVDDDKSGFANFLDMRKTAVDRGILVEKKDELEGL